ncbi:MAG: hypothetical protein D6739_05225 [Nitrospirae bacterium]|nr:MAG: hypothetical protein D6739_05225 [Nitrospirota bacterium]
MAGRSPVIAALLSALVLPGVGQLYLGRRGLGGLLILLTTASLAVLVAGLVRGLSGLPVEEAATGEAVRALVDQAMARGRGWLTAGGLLLLLAWVWGVADALRGVRRPA